ncbi:MAG: hypothetical protein JXQ90_21380 [Cyclobacteriaceae bacterium]
MRPKRYHYSVPCINRNNQFVAFKYLRRRRPVLNLIFGDLLSDREEFEIDLFEVYRVSAMSN